MINIVLCDDESTTRFRLKSIIEKELKLKNIDYMIYEYASGEALTASMQSDPYKFDIIFLDIEMHILNGIETANTIRKSNKNCKIIFVTGFTDYVFQGYDVGALNYIIKPYNSSKIIEVLSTALYQITQQKDEYYMIRTKDAIYKIPLSDIIYFYSDKRKIIAITLKTNYDFYHKLDEVELEVGPLFIRTHQRYLVHSQAIKSVGKSILLSNNEKIPISSSKQKNVMLAFARSLLA